MIYKLYPIKIISYLIAIIIAASISFILFFEYQLFATGLIVSIVMISLGYSLYQFLNRVNRDLARFILAIKNEDTTQKFSHPNTKSFQELYQAFNIVFDKIQEERSENINQYYLLQMVIEHIKVALISYKIDGEVDLYNQSARTLFGIPYLTKIIELKCFDESLVDLLISIQPNRRTLLKVDTKNGVYQLAIEVTEFKQNNETYRLASIQNIKEELEQQEIDSWQKLIRVLNHEVFNSITPIVSLSESTKALVARANPIENADLIDINRAFDTIKRRGKNLLEFVERFRSISHLPTPVFEVISVSHLIKQLYVLQKAELDASKINFSMSVQPETIEITADRGMIEQVMINIIKNSIQAMQESEVRELSINASLKDTYISFEISDTGQGISKESADKIFIPFFSTKPNGSGIGLSLSKQIMAIHKGDIKFESDDTGTTFILNFY